MRKENEMRSEIQKAINDLYHKGENLEIVNLLVSYIEMLESENAELLKKLAKLVMLYDKAD